MVAANLITQSTLEETFACQYDIGRPIQVSLHLFPMLDMYVELRYQSLNLIEDKKRL